MRHEEPFPANPNGKIENLTFRVTDTCYYGTFLALQTLNPGESIVLAASDYRVRDMLGYKGPGKRDNGPDWFRDFRRR